MSPLQLEALRIVLLFVVFVVFVLILFSALANTKLTKEKKRDRLREQDVSQAKPASTHISRLRHRRAG